MQLLPRDARGTSNIANVRIYVEQAIGRLKFFLLLKIELPISLLPLADDIVRVCGALCYLLPLALVFNPTTLSTLFLIYISTNIYRNNTYNMSF